eukprot:jgi/Bigna1/78195/fgenesh1_pg.53_\
MWRILMFFSNARRSFVNILRVRRTKEPVAHVSQCLAAARIPIFYVSTLSTDYVLVRRSQVALALKNLRDRFNVIIDYEGSSSASYASSSPKSTSAPCMIVPPPLAQNSTPNYGPTVGGEEAGESSLNLNNDKLMLGGGSRGGRNSTKSGLDAATKTRISSSVSYTSENKQLDSSTTTKDGNSNDDNGGRTDGDKDEEKGGGGTPVSSISLELLTGKVVLISIERRYLELLVKPILREILDIQKHCEGEEGEEEKQENKNNQKGKGDNNESLAQSASSSSSPDRNRFFGYTDADDEISLVISVAAYKRLTAFQTKYRLGGGVEPTIWRVIRVNGEWGFNEVGLVAGISSTLHASKIELSYLSTYPRDFVMVPDQRIQSASEQLKARPSMFTLQENENSSSESKKKRSE